MSKRKSTEGTRTTSVKQLTGATFVSVLLGLVLKNLLDAFFPNPSLHNEIVPAVRAVIERGWFSLIVTAQLGIFLFTLVRFYLGSFRYHEEEPEVSGSASELIIDLIGAIGVFVSFYGASIFVKTTNLFYVALTVSTLIDLMWFWVAKKYSSLNEGMELVAGWYVFFDIISLVALFGFFVLTGIWGPWPRFLPQWLVLGVFFLIGIWDLRVLWPFYSGAPDWQEPLKNRSPRRRR
jgi:hypothetical protein